ncbi:hypothetical protein ACF0H5_010199 [Mactra antiquata]
MRWLGDGNRLSVHNLKQVVESKIPLDDYECGMRGLSKYRGCPGLRQFRNLNVDEKYVTQKMLAEQSLSKITQQDGKVHSQCVSRKEFRKLKDEVRRLKQKLVSLTEPSSTESEQKATSTSSVLKSPQSFSSSSVEESDTYNGFTLHDLKDSICHTDKLYEAVTV